MSDDLNASGDCMGPQMKGCLYGAKVRMGARLESNGVLVEVRRYHCAACFEIYRRRYT